MKRLECEEGIYIHDCDSESLPKDNKLWAEGDLRDRLVVLGAEKDPLEE